MERILNKLGFEDITKEHPIQFSECVPTSFDSIYHVNKRFKRVNNKITTFILIGKLHNFIEMYGDSYYKNKWSRFYLTVPIKYFKEQFLFYLNANENKVFNL